MDLDNKLKISYLICCKFVVFVNCVYIKNGIVMFIDEMFGDCYILMLYFIVEVYFLIWFNWILSKYKFI